MYILCVFITRGMFSTIYCIYDYRYIQSLYGGSTVLVERRRKDRTRRTRERRDDREDEEGDRGWQHKNVGVFKTTSTEDEVYSKATDKLDTNSSKER